MAMSNFISSAGAILELPSTVIRAHAAVVREVEVDCVCAWCGCILGQRTIGCFDPENPRESHGICEGCLEKEKKEFNKLPSRIL